MKNSVLLIIDMVNGFCKEGPLADPAILAISPAIKNLYEKLNAPKTIFFADTHSESDPELKSFPPHCLKGSSESEIIDELSDLEGIRIEKNTTNGFMTDEFQSMLDNGSFDGKTLYLAGCCTDICVLTLALSLQTWINAHNADINLVAVPEALATYNAPGHCAGRYHQSALDLMALQGIDVRALSEIESL